MKPSIKPCTQNEKWIEFSDRLVAAKTESEIRAIIKEFDACFPDYARKFSVRRDAMRASSRDERESANKRIDRLNDGTPPDTDDRYT